MGTCLYCRKTAADISRTIGFCVDCIREHFNEIRREIFRVHEKSRRAYGLPEVAPRSRDGVACALCVQECRIPEGGTGYCGLRKLKQGRIIGGRPHEGNVSYYYDPLPTNCVADFVCPGGTGCGYPRYAHTKGPEHGYKNLAVFYRACSFNCLYCQNYHFYLKDLPTTSRSHAYRCKAAAERQGLRQVHIGNVHLLGLET